MAVEEPDSSTSDRILDAALQVLIDFGVERATVKTVAQYAGVSHMTVYRRWPAKNHLLATAVIRELDHIFATGKRAARQQDSFDDKIVAGFTAVYWGVRSHPLMAREMRSEPHVALPLLTSEAEATMAAVVDCVTHQVSSAAAAHELSIAEPRILGEVLVRLAHSLLLTPPTNMPLATKKDVARYARLFVLPVAKAAASQPVA